MGLTLTGRPLEFPEFRLGHLRGFKMAAAATCGAGTLSSECVASQAGQSRTSSFQRRGKASGAPGGGPRLLSIAGTRPSVRNGQLLVSTGLPALDQLLGRFRIKMWGHSRDNLGWDSRSTHTHFLFPFPLHKHVRIACSDRVENWGRKLGWRCLKSCAPSPP